MNNTQEFAGYIHRGRDMPLTDRLLTSAKLCIMDSLATTIAGYEEKIGEKLKRLIELSGGNKQASLIGTGMKSSLIWTALANGTAAHALDFDDAHATESGHPTATVLPASLALCEYKKFDGLTLMRSLIAGIHVEFAVGAAIMPEHYSRGWHNTGTMGHFGAAAASALVLNLDEKKICRALSLAASQSAGLQANFGTMAKPFHAGKAACNGLLAAMLAEDGFTASEDILDRGFLEVIGVSVPNYDRMLKVLKGEPVIFEVHFKRYPSCFGTHPAIRSALRIKKKYSVKYEEIKEIRAKVYPRGIQVASIPYPTTGLEAKFSIAYCMAQALLKGRVSLEEFIDSAVMDKEAQELLHKITLEPEPSYQSTRSTTVFVHLKDGRILEDTTNLLVELSDIEADKVDVLNKFRQIMEPRIGSEKCKKLEEYIANLENVKDVSVITDVLNRG